MRLDSALHHFGFFDSRQKAQAAVQNGEIFYKNAMIKKPSFIIDEREFCNLVKVDSEFLVSRAAKKLRGFLAGKNIAFSNVLDIGSSCGGFAQILLQNGAKRVVCVDVGSNQLHKILKNDERILSFENYDFRDFAQDFLQGKIENLSDVKFDFLTCDVSFISLHLLIERIIELEIAQMLLLFKPQFEVGKDVKRNKKGVIVANEQNEAIVQNAIEKFVSRLQSSHFVNVEKSTILGKEGNAEYFIYARRF